MQPRAVSYGGALKAQTCRESSRSSVLALLHVDGRGVHGRRLLELFAGVFLLPARDLLWMPLVEGARAARDADPARGRYIRMTERGDAARSPLGAEIQPGAAIRVVDLLLGHVPVVLVVRVALQPALQLFAHVTVV